MYLEKLEINGFKSFGKKTVFAFNDGITGIVGPNGCGKSNVVDAIRWILGEQRAGALRSDRMENVIFNGSANEKPLGMAEASLTIKNTRNILPTEYSEVLVTRRLFRSGESQYLLNKTPCRLKDINDLFMDTGMGPDAYSVIELSMVETILSGKPEERRKILEEAAGVTRYKQRRKAAFRKLEATGKDLTRLNDILSEVSRTVNSLKRQVSKARRYQQLTEELRDADIQHAQVQFSEIMHKLKPLSEKEKILKDQRTHSSVELAADEAKVEEMRTQLVSVETEVSETQRAFNEAIRRIQKIEEELLVLDERQAALRENLTRMQQERTGAEQRAEALTTQLNEARQAKDELGTKLQQAASSLEEADARMRQSQEKLTEGREAAQRFETELRSSMDRLAALRREYQRAETLVESHSQRIQHLREEESGNDDVEGEVVAKLAMLEQRVEAAKQHLDQARVERDELSRQLVDGQHRAEQLTRELGEQRLTAERLDQRIRLLRQLLESYEDRPEPVRYLFKNMEETRALLAEVVTVEDDYRVAVEALLMEKANHILVEGAADAHKAIAKLRDARKGFASFVPMQEFHPSNGGLEGLDASEVPGVRGWAREFVSTTSRYHGLIERLLGRCLVVDSGSDSQRLLSLAQQREIDIVTLDGQVYTSWGSISGGGQEDGVEGMVLGRRAEIGRLEKSKKDQFEKIERQQAALEAQEALITQLESDIKGKAEGIAERGEEAKNLEIELANTQFALDQSKSMRAKYGRERDELQAEIDKLTSSRADLEPEIQEIESRRAQQEEELEGVRKLVRGLEINHDEVTAAASEARVEWTALSAEDTRLTGDIERFQSSIEEAANLAATRTSEIGDGQARLEEMGIRTMTLKDEVNDAYSARDQIEKVLETKERERSELTNRVSEFDRALRSRRSAREAVAEDLHQNELLISELEMSKENLLRNIREKYDIVLEARVYDESVSTEALQEQIQALRNRLDSLGPVNVLALEEYEREKERLDFLESQREDLLEAENNLKQTIEVINDEASRRFAETFEAVRTNFQSVFTEFFDGGEADLRLSDGSDPLEANVEIVARPRGKRMEALTLLSGGEKTLTAISLLFAIYLVKPSPFCILDEVDAPLDDTNIGRFTRALKKFSTNTQFLVVTHNKLTMRSADRLYGVTMETEGLSRVLSVQITEDLFDQPSTN